MSGGLPPCMVVVSLDLKASFSSTVILMFTFGWSAMYCLAASAQIVFIGSLFWMCHQSIETGSPEDFVAAEELGSSSDPPHPATTMAAAATTPSALRTVFTIVSLLLHRMSRVL